MFDSKRVQNYINERNLIKVTHWSLVALPHFTYVALCKL